MTFETAKLALLAQGSVVIKDSQGNYLLTTAGVKETVNEFADFFPLSVEYQERYYSTGKIGGNRFMKREGRPSEASILNSRLIDRPIRPMFPKGTISDVQIISTILSSTGESDFGFYGITGASLSLLLAGVAEFEGPVAGIRMAVNRNGEFIVDPSFADLENPLLDITVAGTLDAVTMVESQGQEASEELVLQAFEKAHTIIKEMCAAQKDFVELYKKTYPIRPINLFVKEKNADILVKVTALVSLDKITPLFNTGKAEFHDALHALETEIVTAIATSEGEEFAKENKHEIEDAVYASVRKYMRSRVLSEKSRLDGRKLNEVRPIQIMTGVLPRTHGSVLFQRGITQALSITTLGGP